MTNRDPKRWLNGKQVAEVLAHGGWAYAAVFVKEFIPITGATFNAEYEPGALPEGLSITLLSGETGEKNPGEYFRDMDHLFRLDRQSGPTEIEVYETRLMDQQLPKSEGGGMVKKQTPYRRIGRLCQFENYEAAVAEWRVKEVKKKAERERVEAELADRRERQAEKQHLRRERLVAAFVGKTLEVAGIEFDCESVTLRLKDATDITFAAQLVDYEIVGMRITVDGSDFDLMEVTPTE